jgi:hypothetical protein
MRERVDTPNFICDVCAKTPAAVSRSRNPELLHDALKSFLSVPALNADPIGRIRVITHAVELLPHPPCFTGLM